MKVKKMKEKYDFDSIESKWQRIWSETNAFKTEEDENKKKILHT